MNAITLRCYRVGLNVDVLATSAKSLIESSKNIDSLAEAIGWNQPENRPFLEEAFSAQKNADEFPALIKKLITANKLKTRRKAKGFPDFTSPRKGLGGWWQKRFDKKELSLPIQTDALEWLNESKRLTLLIAMHESLLNQVMIGDPTEIHFEEISSIPRPLGDMVAKMDMSQARKLAKALQSPLHKIDPTFLVEDITGYISYQTNRGFAYFYA